MCRQISFLILVEIFSNDFSFTSQFTTLDFMMSNRDGIFKYFSKTVNSNGEGTRPALKHQLYTIQVN